METISAKTITIQDLKDQPSLWYKIHVFIYDLRNFQDDPKAQARLDSVHDASYLGLPYFDQDEVQQLKACVVNTSDAAPKSMEQVIEDTLRERLERRMKKRIESEDFRVCTAHDLAPIFEKAFEIKAKDLLRDADFRAVLDRSQLRLKDEDHWTGLRKKTFQPKHKHKHGKS